MNRQNKGRRLISGLVVILFLSGLVAARRLLPQNAPEAWIGIARQRLESAVTPGPLHALHQAEPETRSCFACHESLDTVPDQKCQVCHEETARGVHGTFTGECRECHQEHGLAAMIQLDTITFNHARTRFPLEGGHASVECEKCHEQPAQNVPALTRMRFQGLPFGVCLDCHEDPHQEQFTAQECSVCHNASSWTGDALHFDHDRDTPFALDGAHRSAGCQDCHATTITGQQSVDLASSQLRGLDHACSSCHEDPHEGTLSPTDCTSCHTVNRWSETESRFDHDRDTQFALDATHRDLDCAQCHDSVKYRPLATDCAGCHVEEAEVMSGRFPGAGLASIASPHDGLVTCRECHLPEDQQPTAALHANRCAGCHTEHHGTLFLNRSRRADELEARLRQRLPLDSVGPLDRLAGLRRQMHHNYVSSERMLKEWIASSGNPFPEGNKDIK